MTRTQVTKPDRSLSVARRIFEAWCDTKRGKRFLENEPPSGVVSVDLRTGRVTVKRLSEQKRMAA